jgi:glycosyltransferase involved in cell wall biosynthesis
LANATSDQGSSSELELTSAKRFFDAAAYLTLYPDAHSYKAGPWAHYVNHGQSERRTPNPLFDPLWYCAQTDDQITDPFGHYLTQGWRKLLSPHPLFDPIWYLAHNPDLISANLDPIAHYLEHGWHEGRPLHALFDPTWYLDAYSDVRASGVEPLSHFLVSGWRQGRRPHPLFDTKWFLEQNADLRGSDVNPWLHYIQHGWREGRSPHRGFDVNWYTQSYLQTWRREQEPLAHYLTTGWRDGLKPSENSSAAVHAAGRNAPLLEQEIINLAAVGTSASDDLRHDGRRGTVLLVTHETEVGGAPHVLKQIALFLRDRTRFDVRIAAINGGNLREAFANVAPLLVLSEHTMQSRDKVLQDFAGPDLKAVFVNSIASGGILDHLPADLPTVAFIHELPQLLDRYPSQVSLVRDRASRVIGGGPDVTNALEVRYKFDPEKLVSAVSFIESLPPGTDFVERRDAARAALNIGSDRFVVMGCGLLHWRKSPEKFIETAHLLTERGIDADFVWLGGGPDHEKCNQLVEHYGLTDRVRFTGYEPDVAGKLAGGDLFLLSSCEDPFPLVALYAAQAGLPIVCFKDAGGIEGFVSNGSGIAVPHMNSVAMADAVEEYYVDRARACADGVLGQSQVTRGHTIDVIGPLLLHHIREAAMLPPEVTVVVPNYNYEKYLPERLDSIAAQTFQDFEVVLLDDASSDKSVAVLQSFADRRPGTRLVVNPQNSGSPFVQWLRGMEFANAELIWLAEADDRCTPDLLMQLLPFFNNRNVRIASCASRPITSDGELIGDYRPLYLNRIANGRWDNDYIASDHEEANAGLGIANSIPNASAVVFRKFAPEPQFVTQLTDMRLCGDWYFYCRVMRGGLVGYRAREMNDHRRHESTVTKQLEGSTHYFSELAVVRDYLGRNYHQNSDCRTRIAEFLSQDIARFKVNDNTASAIETTRKKDLPSLLVVAPDLSPGGGQVFALSIANEWAARGGRVVLLNVESQPSHPAMISRVSPEVMLIGAHDPGADLRTLIQRFDIDAVHSSIWWADRWVDDHRHNLPAEMPWIITMHGCHETILAEPSIDDSFTERMGRMSKRASWAYTAAKNLAVFKTMPQPRRLVKIPNGVHLQTDESGPDRAALGLRSDALVLGLASRAIDSKGWHEAVRLTHRLNDAGYPTDLLLIGEGPTASVIKEQGPAHVRLLGQVSNLQAHLRILDIGLLPSYFPGESLPLVLLEMMAQGIPSIASHIGEIPWILNGGDDPVGLLVPLSSSGVDEDILFAHAIKLSDKALRSKLSLNAKVRFQKEFEIGRMLDRYIEQYRGR